MINPGDFAMILQPPPLSMGGAYFGRVAEVTDDYVQIDNFSPDTGEKLCRVTIPTGTIVGVIKDTELLQQTRAAVEAREFLAGQIDRIFEERKSMSLLETLKGLAPQGSVFSPAVKLVEETAEKLTFDNGEEHADLTKHPESDLLKNGIVQAILGFVDIPGLDAEAEAKAEAGALMILEAVGPAAFNALAKNTQ